MNFRPVASLLLAASTLPAAPIQDLREQYGTRSIEAARALDEGMRLVQQKKPADALPRLEKAVQADPDLELGYYWLALARTDLGDIDRAVVDYGRVYDTGLRRGVTNVTVDACINAGLTFCSIGKEELSWPWFTRAILLDADDRHKIRWKAFRNLAIALSKKGRPLAAAMCALQGYFANPERVEEGLVEELAKKAGDADAAQILHFEEDPWKTAVRTAPNALSPAPLAGTVDTPVCDLLPDAESGRVFALGEKSDRYFVIDPTGGNKATAVQAPGPILAGTLAEGRLYLSLDSPPRLAWVQPLTGAVQKTWPLPCAAPWDLAVLVPNGLAAFAVQGALHTFDLDSGKLERTPFPCTGVATDPLQQNCYAYARPDQRPQVGHVIIDGRPIFFQVMDNDWAQSTLFRFAGAGKKLVIAGIRMNAASNGRVLHVSPDGRWVTLVGGGGWRPPNPGAHKAGYGVAVIPATDFEAVQGYYAVDAYPHAGAVNPVTGQVAVVREQDARVHSIGGGGEGVLVKGPFGGSAAAWSPDGRFLYVAGKTGLSSFRNELTPEEIAASSAWKEELAKRKARGTAKPGRGKAAEPLAELAAFSPSIQKAEVVKAIQKAEKEARGMRPPSWQEHPAYVKEPDAGPFYQEMLAKVQRKEWGPLVYQVRERKAKAPEAAPLDYLLALGQYNTNQADKVQGSLQAALKVDRGQTDLSIHCLRGLAAARGRANDAMGSAHCYAMLLLLDPADATLLEEASTVFKKAGLEAESRKLLAKGRASAEAVSGSAPAVKLPPLAAPKSGSVLKGPDLYRQVAPGVVRLQAGDRSGTGVCVADKGWILTNAHVAGETGGTVEVHTFAYQGGKLQPLKALPGTVVYSSAKTDVAVVKLEAPPSTLVAVPVADKDPQPGEKVFAIGSPGLGATTLAQSLSEGIVSAAPRQLPEGVFIQHTAAVNPGNSGGPLVDERGRMVGLVTLKAKLENVGFAIPSVAVRAIFEQASK